MKPDELQTCRDLLIMLQDENGEVAEYWQKMLAHIDSQAAQISELKEKLYHERVAYLRAVNSYHKKDGLEHVAIEQLKAEMPEVGLE